MKLYAEGLQRIVPLSWVGRRRPRRAASVARLTRRGRRPSPYLSLPTVLVLLLTGTAQAQYTWTGAGTNSFWTNGANWGGGGYPSGASDTATFSVPSTNQPTLSNGIQFNTLTVSGNANWTFGGAGTMTNNGGLFYGSTGISSFAPKLVGPGGVIVTAGVLTNGNAGNLYTGDTTVKGGALDVSAAAFNMNVASAAGSNANPVTIGDPATGTNAELRISRGGNRGITVAPGAGTRTIRFTGAAAAYSNTIRSMPTRFWRRVTRRMLRQRIPTLLTAH